MPIAGRWAERSTEHEPVSTTWTEDDRVNRRTTLLACVAVLLVGAAVVALIFSTEPTARRSGATRQTAMLVEVVEARRGSYRPVIEAMGTVEPEKDVVLQPRVSGEIVARAEAFTPGGFIDRGEVLVRIDPSDYENALAQRRSELAEAMADLELEKGRQRVARRDLELLSESVDPESEGLVLRRPQLDTVQARIESARAAVEQAELDLERTTIRAPFDAHILRRDVDVGSQVAVGDSLGRLVGLETYWVVATVPLAKLRWIAVPDSPDGEGATVTIRDRAAWPDGVVRTGHIEALVGALDGRTRMARLLVEVADPFGRRADARDVPPLMAGAFVEARIEAREVNDVVRLDRDHVRDEDTVWVMEDGTLRIRDVEVLLRDARWAYIATGVDDGDRVVTTNLATVTDGARLRLEGDRDSDAGSRGAASAEESGT
jgi:RND family efflux transporter MFP subunit